MVNRLRFFLGGLLIVPTLSLVTTVALPVTTVALPSPQAPACPNTFLTFPAWYKGLDTGPGCTFEPSGGKANPDIQKTIMIIVLNVVNILLQLVGYAAVAFLIIGGFKYMTSQGDANAIAGAKKTIMNAIIGLVISIASVAIVNLIAGAV